MWSHSAFSECRLGRSGTTMGRPTAGTRQCRGSGCRRRAVVGRRNQMRRGPLVGDISVSCGLWRVAVRQRRAPCGAVRGRTPCYRGADFCRRPGLCRRSSGSPVTDAMHATSFVGGHVVPAPHECTLPPPVPNCGRHQPGRMQPRASCSDDRRNRPPPMRSGRSPYSVARGRRCCKPGWTAPRRTHHGHRTDGLGTSRRCGISLRSPPCVRCRVIRTPFGFPRDPATAPARRCRAVQQKGRCTKGCQREARQCACRQASIRFATDFSGCE